MAMLCLQRGKVVCARCERSCIRKNPGDRGCGRRLVISARPRISCSSFNMFTFAAISLFRKNCPQFTCHKSS